ncbi:MAG: hypothetical protein IJY84_01345 [Clostridia bacterium]|nr:hypothetical protein [Clostridia bacterium]
MKKFLISIFAVFALTVGIFLPTVANRNVTAKADESNLEIEDTSNYIENYLLVDDNIYGQWIRIYESASGQLKTTNLTFNYRAAENYSTASLSVFADGIIGKPLEITKIFKPTYVDFFIPADATFTLKPSGGTDYVTYNINDEKIVEMDTVNVRKLVKCDVEIDMSDKSTWTEKAVSVGDPVANKWFRVYKQNISSLDSKYGLSLSEQLFMVIVFYDDLKLTCAKGTNPRAASCFTMAHQDYIDFYIPAGTLILNNEPAYYNVDDITVAATSNYAFELVAPVVEEPETPGDESSSESVIEPETPGESVIEPEQSESNVESSDGLLQDATDWVNETLGLSLSVGALVLICVIAFCFFKK